MRTTFRVILASFLPTLRLVGAMAILSTGVAACSDGGSPTGPSPTPGPAPAPVPAPAPTVESRWDLDVTVRYVKASGDEACDGRNILGAAVKGEFQYRIVASFGSRTETLATPGYGTAGGTHVSLGPEETDNFANETWTFSNLTAGQGVVLTLYATEWDLTSKDSDLDNRSDSQTITPSSLLPTGGTRTDRAVGVGNVRCGLTLYYDVTARLRQITTG